MLLHILVCHHILQCGDLVKLCLLAVVIRQLLGLSLILGFNSSYSSALCIEIVNKVLHLPIRRNVCALGNACDRLQLPGIVASNQSIPLTGFLLADPASVVIIDKLLQAFLQVLRLNLLNTAGFLALRHLHFRYPLTVHKPCDDVRLLLGWLRTSCLTCCQLLNSIHHVTIAQILHLLFVSIGNVVGFLKLLDVPVVLRSVVDASGFQCAKGKEVVSLSQQQIFKRHRLSSRSSSLF